MKPILKKYLTKNFNFIGFRVSRFFFFGGGGGGGGGLNTTAGGALFSGLILTTVSSGRQKNGAHIWNGCMTVLKYILR